MAVSSNILLNIPKKADSGDAWENWHKQCVAEIGHQNANDIFMYDWHTNGNDDANTADLREYLKTQGIALDPTNSIGELLDFKNSVIDKIGDVFSVAGTVGIGIVAVTLFFAGMIIYGVTRPKVLQTAAASAGSRASLMAKSGV